MKRIKIRKSPTADTRTCDWSKVTEEQLAASSFEHIADIRKAGEFVQGLIAGQFDAHDYDKLSRLTQFYADFSTGFKNLDWLKNHYAVSRHHLGDPTGIPEDVNLIDVLEYICDCCMAGLARSGSVRALEICPDVLMRAFHNTAKMIIDNTEVRE